MTVDISEVIAVVLLFRVFQFDFVCTSCSSWGHSLHVPQHVIPFQTEMLLISVLLEEEVHDRPIECVRSS